MGIIKMKTYASLVLILSLTIVSCKEDDPTTPENKENANQTNQSDPSKEEQKEEKTPVVEEFCPQWICEEMKPAEEGKSQVCMYWSGDVKDKGKINANYENKRDACYFSDVFSKIDKTRPVLTNLVRDADLKTEVVKKYVTDQICGEEAKLKEKLTNNLECAKWCKAEQVKQDTTATTGHIYLKSETKKDCEFSKYKDAKIAEFKKTNENLKGTVTGWGTCNKNGDCAKNQCGCVISTNGTTNGRCTTYFSDFIHEELFNAVCLKEWNFDDVCNFFIQNEYGQQLVALGELQKSKELPCLLNFNDVEQLPKLEAPSKDEEGDKEGISLWIIFLVIAVIVVLGIIGYCLCKKSDKNEDFQKIN